MTSEIPQFPLDASKYELLYLIGSGSTSEVYVAKCLTNHRLLAIKLINMEVYTQDIEDLRQEVAFWSNTQHPLVVQYYGSFVSGPMLYILMEYMEGGSVSDILSYAFPKGFQDENIIATILLTVLKALNFIHSNNELHRDIKPGNALINDKGEVKIGDFGVAATMFEKGQRKKARYTVIGTPCYMAPEILEEDTGYTQQADIWSFGITAIALATGQAPYSNIPFLLVIQKILKAPPPLLSPTSGEYSQELCDMIRACLNHNPTKRPTAVELMHMPFFTKAQQPEYLKEKIISKLPPLEKRYVLLHSNNNSDLLDSNPVPQSNSAGIQFDFTFSDETPARNENSEKSTENTENSSSNKVSTSGSLGKFSLNIIDFALPDQQSSPNKPINNNSHFEITINQPNEGNQQSQQKMYTISSCPNKPNPTVEPNLGLKSENSAGEEIQKGRFKVTKHPSNQSGTSDDSISIGQLDQTPKYHISTNNPPLQQFVPMSLSLPPNATPPNYQGPTHDNKLINNHMNHQSPVQGRFVIDRAYANAAKNNEARQNQVETKPQSVRPVTKQVVPAVNETEGKENLKEIVKTLSEKTEKLTEETNNIKSQIQKLFEMLRSLTPA